MHFEPTGEHTPFVRRSRKRVWFFVAPGAELLDIAGPWEVLRHANDVLGRTTLVGLYQKNPKAAAANPVAEVCERRVPGFKHANLCDRLIDRSTRRVRS